MWLPVTRGSHNQRRACPVAVEQCVKLQTAPFKKGTAITIAQPPLLTTLGMMTDSDATAQGYYGGLRGAREAWERSYGRWAAEVEAWAIRFVLGDHRRFYRSHDERYLKAKMGGGHTITTDPEKAAHGEQAIPTADERSYASGAATLRELQALKQLEQMLTTLEHQIADMKGMRGSLGQDSRKDLKWMELRARRMRARLERDAAA